jgi:sigma-B regulation protein RsbU (phosphoserine phosphatase)
MEKLFLHAARMLNSTLEYEALMKLVLKLTIEAVDAEEAVVYRIDQGIAMIRGRLMSQSMQNPRYFKLSGNAGLAGKVAKSRESMIINDADQLAQFSEPVIDGQNQNIHSVLIVPLIGRGQTIGVVKAVNKQDGVFDDTDLDTLVGLANQFAVAIDNANLYRDARREAMQKQLLFQVGKKLSSTLDMNEVMALILDSLQKVIPYDAAGVYLINEKEHELSSVMSRGYDQKEEDFVHLKFGQGLVGWVAKTGQPVIVSDVSTDERYVNARPETKSEISTPIEIDGRVIGAMSLESDNSEAFDNNSLDLLATFASQAAISIERARLHTKMLESKGLEEQLAIARQIQLTFLPKKDPDIPGYDISGINIPSGEVGGDYFDFIKIIDRQTGISIADVSGKGIPAALIMASYRASLIAEIRNNYAIRTICAKVNRLLCESVEQGNYVTAFYGVLDSKNDIFTFSNCGHNRPILLKANDKVCHLSEGGPALGIIDDAIYEERPIFLQSGDIILFYTDGVTEVTGIEGKDFNPDRLVKILRECRQMPARELHEAIIREVRSFAAPSHNFDDLTLIVVKKT